MRAIADQVKDIMRANPNTVGVNDNWNESVKVLRLDLDQDKLRALGVTSQTVMRAANTIAVRHHRSASSAKTNKLIDIVVRQPVEERAHHLGCSNDTSIPTAQRQVRADLAGGARALRVGAGRGVARRARVGHHGAVRRGRRHPGADRVGADRRRSWTRCAPTLPAGYRIELAGAAADSGKAQASIAANVPLVMFIVFTLLMLQLHSFSRALLVFLTGAAGHGRRRDGAAAAATGRSASSRNLGVIALFGMIIRNSVILVDQIEQDIADGADAVGRDRRVGGAPLPADHPDGRRRGAGDDPAVALGVLGADGGGHHGRADRRDGADAAVPAGAVRGLVPGQEAGRPMA